MQVIVISTTKTGYEYDKIKRYPDGSERVCGIVKHSNLESLKREATKSYGKCNFMLDPIPPY